AVPRGAASAVRSAWAWIVGAVVSWTSTVNVDRPTLCDESAAVQVTVVRPSANTETVAAAHATETGPSTTSVAAGSLYVTVAPAASVASTVRSPCGCTIGGAVSARTCTSNESCVTLCAASSAVHVTVEWPTGKRLPEAGAQLTATAPSTASVAEALKETWAPAAEVGSTSASAGSRIDGPVRSRTVTVNEDCATLCAASSDLHDTVVAPSGNVLPGAGSQTTGTVPSTTSCAVGSEYGTAAPRGLAASARTSACAAIAGGAVSGATGAGGVVVVTVGGGSGAGGTLGCGRGAAGSVTVGDVLFGFAGAIGSAGVGSGVTSGAGGDGGEGGGVTSCGGVTDGGGGAGVGAAAASASSCVTTGAVGVGSVASER